MDIITWLSIPAGLVLLVFGGNYLVKGASSLALRFGIAPLVVGLTVVAYGTSAPELVVSVIAGLEGKDNIAVANVVGSNIFNVVFILGACALIAPLVVNRQLVSFDVPLMIAGSIALLLASLDGRISALEGAAFFAVIVWYTVHSVRKSRRESKASSEPAPVPPCSLPASLGWIALGLVLLVLGGDWLVGGAVALATTLGVSDTIIGLTIVAAGTSLPEVSTSIIATFKGERDIAIGNIVGSNLYNIFCILGLASMVTPGGLGVSPEMLAFDMPVMLLIAIACWPMLHSHFELSRREGALMFGGYVLYTTILVLGAIGSPELGLFRSIGAWGFLPLALLIVVADFFNSRRLVAASKN